MLYYRPNVVDITIGMTRLTCQKKRTKEENASCFNQTYRLKAHQFLPEKLLYQHFAAH